MLRSPIQLTWLATVILLVPALPSRATVTDVASNGFTLNIAAHIMASPDKVYAALIAPAKWWSSEHTFSGDAKNFHADTKAGGCWCETLPHGGSALHLTVVYVDPGKALRLRGALGPFQGLGADGALTWKLEPAEDGTRLYLSYSLGGYNKDGFAELSKAADGVLSVQVNRLKNFIESGSPQSR
jgi:uncharacterized protein YndB with AHSA1/START domain